MLVQNLTREFFSPSGRELIFSCFTRPRCKREGIRLYKGKQEIGKGHFSVHPEVPISFSLVIGPCYSNYNNVVRGSPVLRLTSLLPFQSMPVPIYTHGSRGGS